MDLASHLRVIRTNSGLTLADLAARSGVSRATLSRIENGEVSPTADTLGRLSNALAVPISLLLLPLEQDFPALVRRDDQSIWRDEQNGFERRNVSPPSKSLTLELIECDLQPRKIITYETAPVRGQEHHLVLLSGMLWLTVDDQIHHLQPGDCLRYRLSGPSRFQTQEQPARYLIALS